MDGRGPAHFTTAFIKHMAFHIGRTSSTVPCKMNLSKPVDEQNRVFVGSSVPCRGRRSVHVHGLTLECASVCNRVCLCVCVSRGYIYDVIIWCVYVCACVGGWMSFAPLRLCFATSSKTTLAEGGVLDSVTAEVLCQGTRVMCAPHWTDFPGPIGPEAFTKGSDFVLAVDMLTELPMRCSSLPLVYMGTCQEAQLLPGDGTSWVGHGAHCHTDALGTVRSFIDDAV